VVLVLLSTATSALADLRVCNRSPTNISVSVGWQDPNYGWTSWGWRNLTPGSCESLVRGAVHSRVYYLYATGPNGQFWGPRYKAQSGGFFCINPTLKFTAHNRDYEVQPRLLNCAAAGLVGTQFDRVETGEHSDYTYLFATAYKPTSTPPQPPSPPPQPTPPNNSGGSACQRYPNLCS
jgi:uncharacterized membrane protein